MRRQEIKTLYISFVPTNLPMIVAFGKPLCFKLVGVWQQRHQSCACEWFEVKNQNTYCLKPSMNCEENVSILNVISRLKKYI